MATLTSPNPVMNGVEEDLSDFVYKVMRCGDVDFANFVGQWREHHFCYIYSLRNRIREMQYFTREVLILAKKLCSNEHTRAERVIGVYLLYSLYFIQPLTTPVRIRIDKQEFEQLLSFVKEESTEVQYCFFKLFLSHAFDYIYTDKLYSLERIREREAHIRMKQSKVSRSRASSKLQWEQLWKTVSFDQKKWLETESSYNKLKSSINRSFGESANFEMTEFLKPMLTIDNQPTTTYADDSPEETADCEAFVSSKDVPGNAASSSKKQRTRKKRLLCAFNILFEGSSSEEEPVGGTGSMPQIAKVLESEEDASDDEC